MLSGFLIADRDATARQRQRLEACAGGRPLVGLSWRSGNAAYGVPKSLEMADLLPLLRRRDVFWIDLQYGATSVEHSIAAAAGAELWRAPDVDPLRHMEAATAQPAAPDRTEERR